MNIEFIKQIIPLYADAALPTAVDKSQLDTVHIALLDEE